MKRLVVTFSIIAVLGLTSPGSPAFAPPIKLPHETPAAARTSRNESTLLLTYNEVISLATSSRYRNAQDALKDLRRVELPAEGKQVMDRYSDRCQRLIATLAPL